MARGAFTTGNYLASTTCPISSYPYSISAWGRTTTAAVNQVIACIAYGAGSVEYTLLQFSSGNNAAFIVRNTAQGTATSSTSNSTNTWHHVLGVATNSTLRAVYLDGVGKGTDATSVTHSANIDNVGIGVLTRSSKASPITGYVAEVGIWSAALTDADAVLLAAGTSPLMVNRANLVAYFPCGGSYPVSTGAELDVFGSLSAAETGTVGTFAHNIIIPDNSLRLHPGMTGGMNG